MKTPTVILNTKIKNDSVIKSLFGGKSPNIFPIFAGEPSDGNVSYPYLRYISVPVVQFDNQKIRRDIVQYWAGDKDFDNLVKIIERLIYLVDYDQWKNWELPLVDTSNTYKIQDMMFNGSTPPTGPSQDLGVFEQGISCTIIYTIHNVANIWALSTTTRQVAQVDALLL